MKFKAPIRMPFGKHKNEKIEDVPTSYIIWVLENTEVRNPLKQELENQLRLRDGEGVVRSYDARAEAKKQYWVVSDMTSPATIYGPYGSKDDAASLIIKMGLSKAHVIPND